MTAFGLPCDFHGNLVHCGDRAFRRGTYDLVQVTLIDAIRGMVRLRRPPIGDEGTPHQWRIHWDMFQQLYEVVE